MSTTPNAQRMDALCDKLRATLTDGKGSQLVHAHDNHRDMLADLATVLYASDRDTAAPNEVITFVDEVSRALHVIRSEAVTECRRRLDAAMERSGQLLEDARRVTAGAR